MKIKTSVTLSEDLVRAIDKQSAAYRSRSEFLEIAGRSLLREIARRKRDARDFALLNRHADALNREAEDVLLDQAPL